MVESDKVIWFSFYDYYLIGAKNLDIDHIDRNLDTIDSLCSLNIDKFSTLCVSDIQYSMTTLCVSDIHYGHGKLYKGSHPINAIKYKRRERTLSHDP